jgi:hypothetical protein
LSDRQRPQELPVFRKGKDSTMVSYLSIGRLALLARKAAQTSLPATERNPAHTDLLDRIAAQNRRWAGRTFAATIIPETFTKARISDDIRRARDLLSAFNANRVVSDVRAGGEGGAAGSTDHAGRIAALDSFLAEARAGAVDGKLDLAGMERPEEIAADLAALEDDTRPDALTYDETGGKVVIDAEEYARNTPSTDGLYAWSLGTGDQVMAMNERLLSPVHLSAEDLEGAARLDYRIDFTTPGTYHVWARGSSATAFDFSSNSIHFGFDGEMVTPSDGLTLSTRGLAWSDDNGLPGQGITIEVAEAGTRTLNIWMREDGVVLDALALTVDGSYDPATDDNIAISDFRRAGEAGPVSLAAVEAIVEARRMAIEAERDAAATDDEVYERRLGSSYLSAIIEAQERGLARLNAGIDEDRDAFMEERRAASIGFETNFAPREGLSLGLDIARSYANLLYGWWREQP